MNITKILVCVGIFQFDCDIFKLIVQSVQIKPTTTHEIISWRYILIKHTNDDFG